ncbi:MAG: hypothetical protein LBD20_00970 [Spirochaetaceae bacterium]|jgi:hypothetical protein|nr:hypothetical protein [Spirochaetaceae bacterium]
MKTPFYIKFLKFVIRTEGLIFFAPPILLFLLGAPAAPFLITALAGLCAFSLFRFWRKLIDEKLRKFYRSPVECLIEDNGLSPQEAQAAWNEVENITER